MRGARDSGSPWSWVSPCESRLVPRPDRRRGRFLSSLPPTIQAASFSSAQIYCCHGREIVLFFAIFRFPACLGLGQGPKVLGYRFGKEGANEPLPIPSNQTLEALP